jgi:hypothetical protein
MSVQAIARRATQFLYIANQRRADSLALLRASRWSAALYMAGYVFECALKAVIAKNVGGTLDPVLYIHDLVKLRATALRYVNDCHLAAVHAVPNWTHLQRYDCASPSPRDVVAFLNKVNEAYRCLTVYI